MTTINAVTEALTTALREAIEYDDDNADLARHITRALLECGADVDIESDDPEEEEMGDDMPRGRRVVTTQEHRMVVDGETVATLIREGWSYYGSIDHPNTPSGEWTTEAAEDDSQPSDAWLAVAEAAKLSGDWDTYPSADEEEYEEPETDDEGDYCLWWITSGSESGPLTDERYASFDDARRACLIAEHELHCQHRGPLLCGYGIAVMGEDGEWRLMTDADED